MSDDIKTKVEKPQPTEKPSNSKESKKDDSATSKSTENKAITFKDWKSLKESQKKSDEKPKNSKLKKKVNDAVKKGNARNNNNDFNRGGPNIQGPRSNFIGPNNFSGSNGVSVFPPLAPPPDFKLMGALMNAQVVSKHLKNEDVKWKTNFNDNFNWNNSYNNRNFNDNFNDRNFNDNFNDRNFNDNFNDRNFNDRNFNDNFNNGNFNNNFNNGNFNNNNFNNGNFNNFRGRVDDNFCGPNFNGPSNRNMRDLPDAIFAADGIYRQKDFMQQPLSLDDNPFRDEDRGNELVHRFRNREFKKPNQRNNDKPKGGNRQQGGNKPIPNSKDDVKINNKPKVFVANPKGSVDGKPYIPKPVLPEQNPDISFEERKQQWKDYRAAMKPFKNRDFYNAKRVVQRLGKKDPSELDEKEILRLANSREIMAMHKERISAKYPSYTKDEASSNNLGELYLLKTKPLKDWNNGQSQSQLPMQSKAYQNYGNFGDSSNSGFGNGRKIVGGFGSFRGFVSGGILNGPGNNN